MATELATIDDFVNENKEGYIKDILSNEWIKDGAVEQIKQKFLKKLIYDYEYTPEHIRANVPIKSERNNIKGTIDIVVFNGIGFDLLKHAYVVIDLRQKDRQEAKDKLNQFLILTQSKYGIWYNGEEITYYQKDYNKKDQLIEIIDIPKYKESIEDVGNFYKKQLKPASELQSTFETIHNFVYANEGLLNEKIFNEILKIIFVKLVDEKLPNPKCEFRITEEEMENCDSIKCSEFVKRINNLFIKVKNKYPDVFDQNEKLNLKPSTIGYIVSQLQKYSLTTTPSDVKGVAFQTFIYAHQRGDRGEFFTPKPILELCIEFLDPKIDESILDPGCGPGGFLVSSIDHIKKGIKEKDKSLKEKDIDLKIKKYAKQNVYGIDFNPDIARVAKLYMILNGDGHNNIFSENSLVSWDNLTKTFLKYTSKRLGKESFDIIMTNPPFGSKGKITSKRILEQFDLGYKWICLKNGKFRKTTKLQNGQIPDILFIERCLDFLKPGGRMVIVLPDGDLTNKTFEYVRYYINSIAKIIAVVSLPSVTFTPYGAGVKASVLFLQKLDQIKLNEVKNANYKIFTAVMKKIGYDIRGSTIFKKDKEGNIIKKATITENYDKTIQRRLLPVIDTDILEIVEEFKKFKKEENISW